MKQTAVEFLHSEYKRIFGDTMVDIQIGFKISDVFKQAKEMEKQQQDYNEEDMVKFVSFVGKNYIKAKGFYYMKGDFEKKHKVSIHQILEQFKKK
jgi:hypothetical protein